MTIDYREQARARVTELATLLRSADDPASAAVAEECDALARAIAAFHMEGIRFRIYNVDRLLRAQTSPPDGALAVLEDARRNLEAAGFHTRSHQSPV